MLPTTEAIEVVDLEKHYGTTQAVDGLSLTVASGEVFGILGPNGAGKTTTVEILEGYRSPDGGRVRVLGLDPIRCLDVRKLLSGYAGGRQPPARLPWFQRLQRAAVRN